MAFSLASSSARSAATISTTRRPAVQRATVVAQAVGPRAAEAQQQQQQQQRVLVATQASATWAPLAQQPEQTWFSHLAQLFGQPAQQEEDEEWKQVFGSYLDPAEEAGHRHGMFVSHLAERMALEPRSRS